MITTGGSQIDVSDYLVPRASHPLYSWKETESEIIYFLRPSVSVPRGNSSCSCLSSGTEKARPQSEVGSQGDDSLRLSLVLLPVKWRAARDEASGKKYFFHLEDLVPQWDPPALGSRWEYSPVVCSG